ncbi:MAG: cation:proton antiporter family protein [Gammaproteobacteria bacterium]|nr:cation:proton antiporter family protein [Gammaproteobacteria bacterium]
MEAIWIGSAFVLGLAVKWFGLPPLVGFLAAGFALNAIGFERNELLDHVAHLGVLLLLFSVGLKVRLKNFVRAEVWAGGILHLAMTGLILGAALHVFAGMSPKVALIVALALGFSSTVIAAKVLEAKRELRAFHGRVSIGILIIQDLVAVGLLSVGGGHAPSPWVVVLFALPLLRPVLTRLLEWSGHEELLVLFGALLAIGVGGLGFELVGLSSELGALVVGAMLADHPRAQELSSALWSLKEIFLVGFFLQIGMSGLPGLDALLVTAILMLVLPIKAALFFFILLRFHLRARTSFLTALTLASYSEFGLIVGQLVVRNGWLGEEWLVYLALTVAISFILAAPFNKVAHGLYERFEPLLCRFETKRKHPDDEPISLGNANIAILGMGRVGTGAYDFLTERGTRVIGLDSDPGKIEQHRERGRRVLYADAEDPGFWTRLKLDNLDGILLALPDPEAKCLAIRRLRRRGYSGLISATNVYPEEESMILEAGATTTFNYFAEAGVGFAEHTWEALMERKPDDAVDGQPA